MTVATIKGYYPLHLIFPASLESLSGQDESDEEQDESNATDTELTKKMHTFMYFKPHQISHSLQASHPEPSKQKVMSVDDNRILFVANVPMIPGIQSTLLLEYIFGMFGKVDQVVIVPSPRRSRSHPDGLEFSFLDDFGSTGLENSFHDVQGDFYYPGKFAHVYFQSVKERKRALQHVTNLSNGVLHLDSDSSILELKELSNASNSRFQEFVSSNKITSKMNLSLLQEEDFTIEEDEEKRGIRALVRWHQRSIPCRTLLQQKCDEIMSAYEGKEDQLQKSLQQEKSGVADEDGFITVSYKTMASSLIGVTPSQKPSEVDLSSSTTTARSSSSSNPRIQRRATSSRGAPKKDRQIVRGSDPLPDFYKFQTRDSRKRSADELKSKFQQDLQRVKKMRDEKEYRPF
jgi:ribosomal RNA-processing protein 7